MIPKINTAKKNIGRILVIFVLLLFEYKEKMIEVEAEISSKVISFLDLRPGEQSQTNTPRAAVPRDLLSKSNAFLLFNFLVLVALYTLLEVTAEYSVEKIRFVRWLIMRKEDIEGRWIDIVFLEDKILGVGCVTISYKEGQYRLEGDEYDTFGKRRAFFNSELSRYVDETVDYKYRLVQVGGQTEVSGHGQYRMSYEGKRTLQSFNGNFTRDGFSTRYYTYGERLDKALSKADLSKFNNQITRPEVIISFLEARKETFTGQISTDYPIVHLA